MLLLTSVFFNISNLYLSVLFVLSTWIVKIAWDLLDVEFIAVAPVVLPWDPSSRHFIVSSSSRTVVSLRPVIWFNEWRNFYHNNQSPSPQIQMTIKVTYIYFYATIYILSYRYCIFFPLWRWNQKIQQFFFVYLKLKEIVKMLWMKKHHSSRK